MATPIIEDERNTTLHLIDWGIEGGDMMMIQRFSFQVGKFSKKGL